MGISGGADSMALMHAVSRLNRMEPDPNATPLPFRERTPWRPLVIHVNHGVRGAAADADERLVRETAAQIGLPCVVAKLNQSDHSETALREARYAAFADAMRPLQGTRLILLAHHRRDQAETLLLRMARGTGWNGLAGMPLLARRREFLIGRPFLRYWPSALRKALNQGHHPWSDDATNLDLTNPRNRVRHEILPLLEQLGYGSVAKRLAALAQDARIDRVYWRATMRQAVRSQPDWPRSFSAAWFVVMPTALKARLIMQFLHDNGARVNRAAVEELSRLVGDPKAQSPKTIAGLTLRRRGDVWAVSSLEHER